MVRVRCAVAVLLVLVCLPSFGATRKSSSRPPKDLHKVGDHWTPYNPPDPGSFPAGSTVHIIVPGDTLWGLAAKSYGNGYLWPQLWEANTYITDAHWIYPGDPLLIVGERTSGEVTTTTGVSTGDAIETGSTVGMSASTGPPIPLGDEADIFCFGYLGDPAEPMPNVVRSFEDKETKYTYGTATQDMGVSFGDIVYINGGTSTGLAAGENYLVIEPGELIEHPRTEEVIGRHYDFRGRIRILCATETEATGIVSQSCKPIHVGNRLKPVPLLPIPLARVDRMVGVCDPPSGKASGFIVNAKDFYYALGVGSVVEINLGREEMVEPGDFLTVFRDSDVAGDPRLLVGEIGILTAEGHTATAKILQMRYSMVVGDRVEMK